jgi:hypothetical protein
MKGILALVLLSLLFGCASTNLNPMPQSPDYTTSEGRTCASACQGDYVECVKAWQYSGSCLGLGPVPADRVNECRLILDECYQFCLEEEK